MANRRFSQFTYTTENNPVDIYFRINFGSTGAPTLATGSKYITSVVRNSTGNYTITLKDKYNSLLAVGHSFLNATAPAAPSMYTITNSVALTTPLLTVQFNAAGTATDPASGEAVFMRVTCKNSSV